MGVWSRGVRQGRHFSGVGVCSSFQPFNANARLVKPLIQGTSSTKYGILNELNLDGIKTSTFITLQGPG